MIAFSDRIPNNSDLWNRSILGGILGEWFNCQLSLRNSFDVIGCCSNIRIHNTLYIEVVDVTQQDVMLIDPDVF